MRRRGDSSTAATIFAASGSRYCSIGSEYGIVASSAQTSCTGAFSDEKPSEAASAAITAAAEPCRVDWSTTTSRPVFSTDARIVAVSSGASVRGSITSASTPSAASRSAASSACPSM